MLGSQGRTLSKYWGYVCRSHDPELVSEHWYNHGEQALTELYRKFHAEPWPINEWGELEETEVHGQMTTAPVYWLNQHRNCNVALHNEYNDVEEIPDRPLWLVVVEDIAYTPTGAVGPYVNKKLAQQAAAKFWADGLGANVVELKAPQ